MQSEISQFQLFRSLFFVLICLVVNDVDAQEEPDSYNVLAMKEISKANDHFYRREYHLSVPIMIELKKNRSKMDLKTLRNYSDIVRKVYVELELFKEAKDAVDYYGRAIDSKDSLNRIGYENAALEVIAYAEKDYKMAIIHAEASCELSSQDMFFVAGKWNNIGIYYQEMGAYELADRYFYLAQNRVDSIHKSIPKEKWELKTAIDDNIAMNLLLRNNKDQALEQYLKNQRLLDSLNYGGYHGRLIRTNVTIASMYMERGRYAKAKHYLLLADSLTTLSSTTMWARRSKKLYSILHNAMWEYYNTVRDSKNAEKYYLLIREDLSQSQAELKQAISSIGRLYKLQYDQQLINEEQINKKNVLLESERTNKWIGLIIALLLFIGLIVYYSINKVAFFKKKSELVSTKLRIETLEVEKLSAALDYTKKDFNRLALIVERKEVLLKKLMEHEEEISELTNGENEVMNTLIEEIQNELIIDRDNLDYQIQANIVNTQFYETLDRLYPGISELNKELCAQIVMKLSLKQIARVRGVNPASVNVAKVRLKKSFGLNPEDDFYEYLSSLNETGYSQKS